MSKALDIRHRRSNAHSATSWWEAKAAVNLGKIPTTNNQQHRVAMFLAIKNAEWRQTIRLGSLISSGMRLGPLSKTL
jgi:PIN domain nuclease of toxin-antitoxin system